MSGELASISYGDGEIVFTIVRRPRTTLEIAVEPDMSVVVAAPPDASITAIADRVRRRAAWVRRQQRFFAQFAPRTPKRSYVAGETHRYLGRQYLMRVVPGSTRAVSIARGVLQVRSDRPDDPEVTRDSVSHWYLERAKARFPQRLEVSLARFPNPEAFRPKALVVRRLRQRWGSMSPSARLLLNTQLVEAPVDAIDYVITHELCHIAEPNHGSVFYELLDRVLPDWPKRKARLERMMA